MGRCPKDGPAPCARLACVAEMNAVAPVSDKLDPSIRWLSTNKDGEVVASVRAIEHLVARVHALGQRPLAEMLAEIAIATGHPEIVADRVEAYAGLDPEAVRFVGGDKFPPMPLELVK